MAERTKITWKGENPPRTLQTTEDVFDATDLRRKANETLDDLKKELYASGIAPSTVSKQWQAARLLHDQIVRDVATYQSETDTASKAVLQKELKERLTLLKGGTSDDLYESKQEVLLAKPNKKGYVKKKKDSMKHFDKVFDATMYTETQEHIRSLNQREAVIRARLNELEAEESANTGIKKNREPEVLALEEELRQLEQKKTEARRPHEPLKESKPEIDAVAETVEPLEVETPIDSSESVDAEASAETDTEHPIPADGIIDAEFEDTLSDSRDLVPVEAIDVDDAVESERANFYGTDSLDATPKETRQKYRETVSKAEEEAVDKLNAQQENVKNLSKEYFAALKAEQKARGAGSKIVEDLTGFEGTTKATKQLRSDWIRARAEFALAQKTALDARLADRPKTREELLEGLKYRGRQSLDELKVRARYERMVTTRTVVMGAEEAELAVKMEGLSERDKTSLDNAYEWYKTLPPSVRIFGTSAAILGLTTGAGALLGGAAIGFVPLGLAGASAALRFWAEKNNNQNAKQWIGGLSRLTSIGGAFGAVSQLLVSVGHGVAGTERKAGELLSQNEGLGNLADEKNLKKLSKERKGALGVKDSIARQGRLARILGSIGGGMLFGHFFSHPHSSGDVSLTSNHDIAPNGHPNSSGLDEENQVSTDTGSIGPDGLLVGATIHHNGEGFGEMIQEFKGNFRAHMPEGLAQSPAMAHVLSSNPNDLTHEILVAKDGTSLTMHIGDQFVADEHQNIWFQPKGGEPQLVFENNPSAPGGFIHHEIHGHMQVDGGTHHTASEAVSTHSEAPRADEQVPVGAHTETPDDVTARLNTEGRMGHPIASPEASAPVAPEASPVSSDDVTSAGDTSAHQDEGPEAVKPVVPEQPTADAPSPEPESYTPSTSGATESAPLTPTPSTESPVTPEVSASSVQAIEHPFAAIGASPDLNPNGVDLNQPQILLNQDRWFAHGIDTTDSYNRAVSYSQELAKTTPDSTNVYFIAKEHDVFGREYLAVRMVFVPRGGDVPQMAPYGEGLSLSPQFVMPPLPKDADYQLPPR